MDLVVEAGLAEAAEQAVVLVEGLDMAVVLVEGLGMAVDLEVVEALVVGVA